jgi:hypothetical protein
MYNLSRIEGSGGEEDGLGVFSTVFLSASLLLSPGYRWPFEWVGRPVFV